MRNRPEEGINLRQNLTMVRYKNDLSVAVKIKRNENKIKETFIKLFTKERMRRKEWKKKGTAKENSEENKRIFKNKKKRKKNSEKVS